MRKDLKDLFGSLGLITYIGITMAACIVISAYIGYWVDSLLNTKAVFLILFLVIGVAAGYWNVYKAINTHIKKE